MALCIRIARRYQGSIGGAEPTIRRSGATPSAVTRRRPSETDGQYGPTPVQRRCMRSSMTLVRPTSSSLSRLPAQPLTDDVHLRMLPDRTSNWQSVPDSPSRQHPLRGPPTRALPTSVDRTLWTRLATRPGAPVSRRPLRLVSALRALIVVTLAFLDLGRLGDRPVVEVAERLTQGFAQGSQRVFDADR